MNKILILMTLVSFTAISQSKFHLDLQKSGIEWEGTYTLGGGHKGIINLLDGNLLISSNNKTTKGDFTIDMNSIRSTDQKDENNRKDLDNHLKADDFFATARFPKATFSIIQVDALPDLTKTTKFTVKGVLTIKGISNPVTIPAIIIIEKGMAHIMADITIDRTKWGITFESRNFMSSIKDNGISDEIKISLDLRLVQTD